MGPSRPRTRPGGVTAPSRGPRSRGARPTVRVPGHAAKRTRGPESQQGRDGGGLDTPAHGDHAPRRRSGGPRVKTAARRSIDFGSSWHLTIRRPIASEPNNRIRRACYGGSGVVAGGSTSIPGTKTSRRCLPRHSTSSTPAKTIPRPRAGLLGCSPSQLIKFLKESPRAWSLINERRRAAGRHPLFVESGCRRRRGVE